MNGIIYDRNEKANENVEWTKEGVSEWRTDSEPEAEEFLRKRSGSAEAQRLVQFGGKAPGAAARSGSFGCEMGHLSSLESRGGCATCLRALEGIRRFAEMNGGELLSEKISHRIELRCKSGHAWSVTFKKAKQQWCKKCRKVQRILLRDAFSEETKHYTEQQRLLQNQLLDEAKNRLFSEKIQQNCDNFSLTDPSLCGRPQSLAPEAVKGLLAQVEEIAERKAQQTLEEFQSSPPSDRGSSLSASALLRLSTPINQESNAPRPDSAATVRPPLPLGAADISFEKLKEMFRILIVPSAAMLAHFRRLSIEQLKNEFRASAVLIHPDKNAHPSAKAAFQKLLELFENAQI